MTLAPGVTGEQAFLSS